MTQILDKNRLRAKKWRSFTKYPRQHEAIMLHITAHCINASFDRHFFETVVDFDARTFDKTKLLPDVKKSSFKFSWLPIREVIVND